MASIKGKTVFITGASAGIGAASARAFAAEGTRLIITARRIDRLENLAAELKIKFGVEVLTRQMDVQDREQVEKVINDLPAEWADIDILLNNAGLALGLAQLHEDDPAGWDTMIDVNIKGALYVVRAIVSKMVKRGSGHVINMGSIAGHQSYPKGSVYCATKHAIKAITRALRMETVDKGIRVSSVDPGAVETDFSMVRFNGDEEKAKNVYKGIEPLVAEDIADAILYCATRPAHVNINEMTIMPSQQANAFVIHRKET